MMTETVVEKAVCESCGAEVRDESLFCYNCGKSVAGPSVPSVDEKSDELVRSEKRPPLTSAASLRKQRRAYNRQPVEITWERRDGSQAVFIIATLVLVFGALVLLILALYLR